MSTAIFNLLPNLKPFHHDTHYKSLFLNQNWVLVNGINNKKAVYVFKDENTLHISENEITTETSWCIATKNTFLIETEDGKTTVKAYFKDDDILVLNRLKTDDCAVFINENSHCKELNTFEDVQQFLHNKYKEKANNIIAVHEFYYIEKSEEFGPFTVEELTEKVNSETISEYCFVRDVNEYNYNKRLRIRDLIREL
ncbi:hypothetical protein KO494_13320 [Lacinutrix sp. C3R15]|uniref:hypothetical protein n=1 Tax=Flavobacteriaceae TaxID=49546 RepID=UPI001C088793|nr:MULTISPECIES: hypothetical protein [Flavobacteriaceae]MBU2940522.1 hypothetical protein [Lacinutrix sp. C3R15]MDO6623842.1 hypothetical protein [Oceanihabitans sp. 1_MG-2023]